MTNRALITGASGFVGQRLRSHLLQQGWEVVGCGFPPNENTSACDITQRNQIDAVLDTAGDITHVFHLAAITFIPDANRDPNHAISVNLLGTIQLLHAMHERLPNARFLNIGSADAYGHPQTLPINEDHPLNPKNPYAIAKAAADQYCDYYTHAAAMDIIRLRPFNHTGPGQSDQFVLSSFAKQIAQLEADESRPPQIYVGNLEAARDFSHVDDIIHGYTLAATHGKSGTAYNLCSGQPQKIADALQQLLQQSTRKIEVNIDPERMRPLDVPEVTGSHQRITQDTGWTPKIPFETLLTQLLDYWRSVRSPDTTP